MHMTDSVRAVLEERARAAAKRCQSWQDVGVRLQAAGAGQDREVQRWRLRDARLRQRNEPPIRDPVEHGLAGDGLEQARVFRTQGQPCRFFWVNELLPLASSGVVDYVAGGLAFYPDRWVSQNVNPLMNVWSGESLVLLTTNVPDPFVMASFVEKPVCRRSRSSLIRGACCPPA